MFYGIKNKINKDTMIIFYGSLIRRDIWEQDRNIFNIEKSIFVEHLARSQKFLTVTQKK